MRQFTHSELIDWGYLYCQCSMRRVAVLTASMLCTGIMAVVSCMLKYCNALTGELYVMYR